MPRELRLTNRQKLRSIDMRLLRRIARFLLEEYFQATQFEFCVHLVAAKEMAAVNHQFLAHAGSTDVITFDYSEPKQAGLVSGEVFICIEDALLQAREFGTTWQSELTRYLIHGLLHLHGFDDTEPAARKKMKREEERFLRATGQRFKLAQLHKKRPSSA
jgi:probable rRNA maturation factor